MSKYSGVRDWLRQSGRDRIRLTFDEVAELLPGGLPSSAFRYDAWWSNEAEPTSTHSQSRLGWIAAGYRVEKVDRSDRFVTFVRDGYWSASR